MPEVSASCAAAFLLGLMSSVHCLGMCGGIGAALGVADPRRSLLFAFCYNLGRVLCYALLGALTSGFIALLSTGPTHSLLTLGPWLRGLSGLLVVAMGLYIGGWWLGLSRLEKVGAGLWRRVQPRTRALLPPRHAGAALALGALWGLLPCGLIYSSLSWAALGGEPARGALLMAAFGLGTLPALVLVNIGGVQLRRRLQNPGVRHGAAVLLILFGLATALLPWLHATHAHHAAHHTNAL